MGYRLLEGIRVVDLTRVVGGPLGTKIMADLGAEVIKIESASSPDPTRWSMYPENISGEERWNRGFSFLSLNVGKRGITLDLGSEKGREIFKRLVKISDVVVENFSHRVMAHWGLSYEDLINVKPDLIMVSMSGLGHSGPLRDFYMYAPGMEAMSGLTYTTGYPDEPPLMSGFSYGDWVLGSTGVATLLSALYYRQRTGKGQYIDLAGREAMNCQIGEIMMDCTLNERNRMRTGNDHSSAAPHGCYRCKGTDNWVNIAVENDDQWKKFCQAIGNPSWTKEESFIDTLSRWKNRQKLDTLVEGWTSQYDHYEVMEILQKAGVPSGAVLTMKEVHLDPCIVERGFFQVIEHGEGIGKRPIAKQMPAKFKGIESFVPDRAPRFGQDNEYVFSTLLKMSEEEISKLTEEGIISVTPKVPQQERKGTDFLNMVEKQGGGWVDRDYLNELRKKYGEDIGITD